MKHRPRYEGAGSEEISVKQNGAKVEIETTDAFGNSTAFWLAPDEARALAEDLKLTADEAEA